MFFSPGAFLKRLPADVRAHLFHNFSDPISLALKADKIYQSRVSSNPVYAVSSAPEDSVNAVRSSAPSRPRRSATPHASSRQDIRSQSPYMCYYHHSWGSQAKKSSVFLVGKLVHRQEDVHTLPARPSSPLIYLQDSLSSRRFLIDSGASVSVFPDPGSSGEDSGVKLLMQMVLLSHVQVLELFLYVLGITGLSGLFN